MALLKKKEPQVAISARFDRTSPTLNEELAELQAELDRMKKLLGFEHFLQMVEETGPVITVKVIPVQLAPGEELPKAPPPSPSAPRWGPR